MNVILEGCDGIGKSTLARFLEQNRNMDIEHSSSDTKNDLQYHLDLIKYDSVVCDRCNLGEIVYPIIYHREPKMTWLEQLEFMNVCKEKSVIYIIFFASNFEDLKERLFKRGDTEQVLANAEKINILYTMLANIFSNTYDNVFALDISKNKDQIEFFKEIERNYYGK